ncbi:hypothetical protein E1A91_A08G050000v1 [Gossypium mustelinum]|uniref:Uncharacterized protein n=1 Tax=Gossypium mustelinum TaxID=34275 RepID=A0A5D2Y607_GOSMU|nr:hypothetical protein E1A91_A08G050000v1 [Gossypium mustelinum]
MALGTRAVEVTWAVLQASAGQKSLGAVHLGFVYYFFLILGIGLNLGIGS